MNTQLHNEIVGRAPRRFFISYSHDEGDEEKLALKLYESLTEAGFESFLDVKMRIGENWDERIPSTIEKSDYFIVLLSAKSVHSEMVIEEVRLARECRQKNGRPQYLPIRVKYPGPLGYILGFCLSRYQWRHWQNEADSGALLQEIIAIAQGETDAPAEQPLLNVSVIEYEAQDFSRPEPLVDLSHIAAPGGALRPDDPFYIQRDVDEEILDAAQRIEETVVIKAPRQMGKSSLLKRYLLACRRVGKKTALIDLSLFESADLSDYPRFLTSITADLLEKLELDHERGKEVCTQPGLTRFLQQVVLKAIPDSLVIAFDEVDRVLGRPYQTDFFTMLRHWHERRTDVPPTGWARVELALIISTEPYLLVPDADRSPFNVREPIEPSPFNLEECHKLNHEYYNLLDDSQVEQLWDLLGGHPYLTRLAYYRLSRSRSRPVEFQSLMCNAHLEGGPFIDHLQALRLKLKGHDSQDLVAAMRQVATYRTLPNEDAFPCLRSVGLVRRQEGRTVPANQLYARFFGGAA